MKKLLTILFLGIALYSCKIGKNYKGTDFYQPEAFTNVDTLAALAPSDTINTDSLEFDISDIEWWNLYDDPILDSLIRVAFENNRDVLIAAESVLQARYTLNIQNAEFLPKFDVNAQVSRGNFILNNIGDPTNFILGSASVYWELDIWGKLRRQSEAARADMMATEYGYRGVMISLISEVASNYFRLLQAKSQLEIARRNAISRDSMLQIIEARYDKGIVPALDVNQAKVQQTIAAGTVPQYQRNIVQIENSLSILLGQNPGPIKTGKVLSDQKYELEIPIGTPVDLLNKRPDVIAAEYNLVAQNARVGVAQANRLPSLSVTGLLGIAAQDFGSLSFQNPLWNLGGQLVGPLFYWNQRKRAADIEQSKRFQSLYRYENTVFGAIKEVEDILVTIRTTKDEINIAEERKDAALKAQSLSKERYNKGVTSYLEFLEQQRQALDAELLLEQLRANLLSSYVRLYKAIGGGWLSEEERQAGEDAAQNEEE